MFALKCGNPGCTAMIPSDERAHDPCPSCGHSFAADTPLTVSKYAQLVDSLSKNSSKSDDREAASELLKDMKKVLHPMNPLLAEQYCVMGRNFSSDDTGDAYFSQAAEIFRLV